MWTLRWTIARNDPEQWLGVEKGYPYVEVGSILGVPPKSPAPRRLLEQWKLMLSDWESGEYDDAPTLYTAGGRLADTTKRWCDFTVGAEWLEADMDTTGIMIRRQGAGEGQALRYPAIEVHKTEQAKAYLWSTPYKQGHFILMRIVNTTPAQPAELSQAREIVEEAKQKNPLYWWGVQIPMAVLEGGGLEIAVYDAAGNRSNWVPLWLEDEHGNALRVERGKWVKYDPRTAQEPE